MQSVPSLTAKQVFLIDGIGAMLTAVLLSQVMAKYESLFGMPLKILYLLAAIALLYSLYSPGCYFLLKA